jgi:hypothetical protein
VIEATPDPTPRPRGPLPQAGLADLVRVAGAVGGGRARLALAAELLGLRHAEAQALPAEAVTGAPAEPAGPPAARSRPRRETAGTVAQADTPGEALEVVAEALPALERTAPVGTRTLKDLLPRATGMPDRAPEGLFRTQTREAMLRAVGGTRVAAGELDLERIVALLASREPLSGLPRRWTYTTGGMLQLLVDTGAGMAPYRLDAERLPDELVQAAGPDGLELRWFEDCPVVGEDVFLADRLEPEPYRLPHAPARILAVTTFGVRGGLPAPPAVSGRWSAFAAAAAQAGVPVLALTPLPPRRRPAGLPRELRVVTWDRATDIRAVTHAVALAADSAPGAEGSR